MWRSDIKQPQIYTRKKRLLHQFYIITGWIKDLHIKRSFRPTEATYTYESNIYLQLKKWAKHQLNKWSIMKQAQALSTDHTSGRSSAIRYSFIFFVFAKILSVIASGAGPPFSMLYLIPKSCHKQKSHKHNNKRIKDYKRNQSFSHE